MIRGGAFYMFVQPSASSGGAERKRASAAPIAVGGGAGDGQAVASNVEDEAGLAVR